MSDLLIHSTRSNRMPDINQQARDQQSGEIFYKRVDTEKLCTGECMSISGAAIVFRTDQAIENGHALEINIAQHKALSAAMTAYVEVIRTTEISPDLYEIKTEIKGIKES